VYETDEGEPVSEGHIECRKTAVSSRAERDYPRSGLESEARLTLRPKVDYASRGPRNEPRAVRVGSLRTSEASSWPRDNDAIPSGTSRAFTHIVVGNNRVLVRTVFAPRSGLPLRANRVEPSLRGQRPFLASR